MSVIVYDTVVQVSVVQMILHVVAVVGTCLREMEQVVEQHHTDSLILLHGENIWIRGTTTCILTQTLQVKALQHNRRRKIYLSVI